MAPSPRPRQRHLTPAEGARLLSAWRRRGNVTQTAFCERHRVSGPTLRHWLRLGARPRLHATPVPTFRRLAVSSALPQGVTVTIGSASIVVPIGLESEQLHTLFAALHRALGQPC